MPSFGKLLGSDPSTAVMYVGYGVLIARLLWLGLYRKYPRFFVYICFQLARPLVLSFIPYRSRLYGNVFFVSQPILWVLMLLMVLELFQRSLADAKGIAAFGSKFVTVALGVATFISCCTLFLNLTDPSPRYVTLENFLLLDRVVHLTLLLFLMLLTAFLAYFPIALHRNARIHVTLFGFYFLAKTSILLFRTMLGVEVIQVTNMAGRVVMGICLFTWCVLLTRQGEDRKVHSNWLSSREDQDRLSAQLDSINATLMRAVKR